MSSRIPATVEVFADPGKLIQNAAERIVETGAGSIRSRGAFTLALSGGKTPRSLYERLAEAPFLERLDWSSTYIFWGDERNVPPDHRESNYRMAKDAMLDRLPIPPGQIHRIPGELPPRTAAEAYHEQLFNTPQLRKAGDSVPRFDLILLGIGDDGHTASLFPGSAALGVVDQWAAANFVEKLAAWRITLTFPVLNNAREILFLVSGEAKAMTLAQVLVGPLQPDRLPAQGVQPHSGSLHWLVDTAAASALE